MIAKNRQPNIDQTNNLGQLVVVLNLTRILYVDMYVQFTLIHFFVNDFFAQSKYRRETTLFHFFDRQ